jgi:hypothetical protein
MFSSRASVSRSSIDAASNPAAMNPGSPRIVVKKRMFVEAAHVKPVT